MQSRLIDLTIGLNGKQRLTIELDGDFRKNFDKFKDKDVDITVKKYRHKRSLDANAMMWCFCEKIAKVVGITKEEIYRDQIRQVGEFTPLPIKANAIDSFSYIWSKHGIGWFVDVIDDSKLDGYKLVFAYAGSSTYDTKQMSRLIDSVLQEAEQLGIDTLDERERSLLLDAWSPS